MKRIIEFGKIDYMNRGRKDCPVTVEIEIRQRGGEKTFTIDPATKERIYTGKTTPIYNKLSICGTVWNSRRTNCYASGQCLDTIAEYIHTPLFKELYKYWKLYHLNGMHAETPEQEKAIEEWKQAGNKYDYSAACEHLKSIGLYEAFPSVGITIMNRINTVTGGSFKISLPTSSNEFAKLSKIKAETGTRSPSSSGSPPRSEDGRRERKNNGI